MSHIAYLFHEDALDDIKLIQEAEHRAGVSVGSRLSVTHYADLDVGRLHDIGRQKPHPGSGSFIVQIINGERHVFSDTDTDNRFTEWIHEYTEYLQLSDDVVDPIPNRQHHRPAMGGGGKVNLAHVIGRDSEVTKPKGAKVSVNGTKGRPDVGGCSTSIQLMEPDAFLEDFAQNGRR
jgi:hypothetical protein